MWLNIIIGILLIVIVILIHGIVTRYIIQLAKNHSLDSPDSRKYAIELKISRIVIIIFLTSIFEALIWGICYMAIGAIHSFKTALYFSIVTFTTLGYGDITLGEKWQLLASFEAAIGIIIFGWSTAIVMAVVQGLYFPNSSKKS